MQQEPPPLAATSSQPASSSAFFEACFVKDVPDKADGWENDFQPAKQYSAQTTLRISQGSLNSAARKEITQTAASQILNICRYPTRQQLDVVGYKIMTTIKIKDAIGIGYVS